MKKRTQLAVLRAATALSLCAITASVCAQDKDPSSTSSDPNKNASTTSSTTQNANTLGKVERSNKLIGKEVYSSDNQKVGKIKDLIVDLESGRVLYAVVNAKNTVAVAPGVFNESSSDNDIHATIDKAKFDGAPQFASDIDNPQTLAKADFVSKVYEYFGQSAWWQGATAASAGSFNNTHKASDVEGMKVFNESNENIGKVDNLAIDLPAGRVVYVIFAPAYSMKLGSNLYALPPNALTLSPDKKNLICNIDKDKLGNAPHFAKSQWPDLSSPTYAQQVYTFYGKQLWFQGGLQPTGR